MENNENIPQEPIIEESIPEEPIIEESIPQEPVAQESVAEPIAPKASPFADSPYVMAAPASTQPQAPTAASKPRKEGRGRKVLKTLLIIGLTKKYLI